MFSQILAAIAAIPKLIAVVESLIAYMKKAEEEKWFQKSNETFKPLEGPTTDKEKDDAAKNVSDLIRSL